MRNVDSVLEERLMSTQQTHDNNANPATFLRLRRYYIPLKNKAYIEKSRIVNRAGLTDSDIAVCHPVFGQDNTEMWVAYVRSGILHIKYASNHEVMTRAEWNDYWFTANATACSIGFYSTAKHDVRGLWEFVTEQEPWVFWVEDGALKTRKCTPLGGQTIELAVSNVTDCSAVRAPSGERGNWDLGLTVFFVMAGQLYYRQYIAGEWYDAEVVNFAGLSGLTISKIKAFNTWDYRVGIQILTTGGDLYELYTYTEGIGTRGTENLSLDVRAEGKLMGIGYGDGYTNAHLSLSVSGEGQRIYGLSTVPLSARNISVNGDWGRKIEITMDYPNSEGSVDEFMLQDSDGNVFACEAIEFEDEIIRLTFVNFNMAYNAASLTVYYTKGTLMSPVVLTDSFSITFTPTGLVSPSTPAPTVSTIYNL